MAELRNPLYEIKKKAESRSSPFYNPIDREEENKNEIKDLRSKSRSQETEIIRLQGQITELREKTLFYQQQLKSNSEGDEARQGELVNQLSSIPMLIQNKQMKEELGHLHETNLLINGKNRQLEAKNRQLEADLKRMQTKLKELEILQSVRSEQFQAEIQNAKPIIVEDNQDLGIVTEGLKKIIEFVRERLVTVSKEVFIKSANDCISESHKKTNSYNIFVTYWDELRKFKNMGFQALLQSYKSLTQLEGILKYKAEEIFDINDGRYRDTLNEWVINTLTEIKYMHGASGKTKYQKLFRLLGLLYRSEFPIQGEKFTLDTDLKIHFQQCLVNEVAEMI